MREGRVMPNKPAVALDAAPTTEELLSARAAGMTLVQWRAAGKPGGKKAPAIRPWHPYRSKWEADYAKHLELLATAGRIVDWDYEPVRLEIGEGAVYTPDFRITTLGALTEMHEVKGYRREAAMVRIRVAAKLYRRIRFVLVTKVNGEWTHTTIGAQP